MTVRKRNRQGKMVEVVEYKYGFKLAAIYDVHLRLIVAAIENCAFHELKQGWLVGKFPKKTEEAVRGHVFLTVVMFNLTSAYRTDIGQDLAQRGIWRQRLAWEDPNKVFVVAGEHYAISDIEELFILMGREPEICWWVDPAEVRRRYRLDQIELAA